MRTGDQATIEAFKARGGDARLTVYPDTGHDAWTAAYGSGALYLAVAAAAQAGHPAEVARVLAAQSDWRVSSVFHTHGNSSQ